MSIVMCLLVFILYSVQASLSEFSCICVHAIESEFSNVYTVIIMF